MTECFHEDYEPEPPNMIRYEGGPLNRALGPVEIKYATEEDPGPFNSKPGIPYAVRSCLLCGARL